jgi:hypothetical protein
MNSSSGYKAKVWRIWAELLATRQIAGYSALWQAAAYLVRKAPGGYAGLDKDPFIEVILAQDEAGAKLQDDLKSSIAARAKAGGRIRTGCGKHPQAPQAAWHNERGGRLGLIRGIRGPSHPRHRRPGR